MEVAREILENSLDPTLHASIPRHPEEKEETQTSPKSSSSYTMASDGSLFSRDVDYWINGSYNPTETTGVQGSRAAVVQRSTLTVTSTDQGAGLWYILAMLLPLFTINTTPRWRCSPSTILNTAEIFLSQLGRFCSYIRCYIRSVAENNVSRDFFAAAMDVVLVAYAMGFLVLSMYQAEIIG
ncbi:uncharacterized protein LOC124535460 [Vanessa cardui]|uniref:uncharacterized protein LOC124535460 n=1 Tax=Vanessa cardui TaxID=171605 RepID=UPI001F13EF16|nr:uncharacterized protein LOC124535460 [Vanessa cardui]XP_046967643.1 uncharacterized protein LOC124535460 [Vanessa cardui]